MTSDHRIDVAAGHEVEGLQLPHRQLWEGDSEPFRAVAAGLRALIDAPDGERPAVTDAQVRS